jgi:hypothetical protein
MVAAELVLSRVIRFIPRVQMKKAVLAAVVCLLASSAVSAQTDAQDIGERARSASRVVVATVVDVTARFGTNASGDRLIYSDVVLEVSETLKGPAASFVTMTIEGGAIGDLSLEVSDLPSMKRGERGLYFLQPGRNGEWVPHRRGAGIMKLGAGDRLERSSLSLADAQAAVRKALK